MNTSASTDVPSITEYDDSPASIVSWAAEQLARQISVDTFSPASDWKPVIMDLLSQGMTPEKVEHVVNTSNCYTPSDLRAVTADRKYQP